MSKFKIGIGGMVAALLVAFGAFGLGNASVPDAHADITGVWVLPDLPGNEGDIDDPGDTCVTAGAEPVSIGENVPVPSSGGIWICVTLDAEQGDDTTDSADVTFDSNDFGEWTAAICANNDGDGDWFEDVDRDHNDNDDRCLSTEGVNTDEMIVDCPEQNGVPLCGTDDISDEVIDPALDLDTVADSIEAGGILVFFSCDGDKGVGEISITTDDPDGVSENWTFEVECRGNAATVTISANPLTVEIVPARSNTSHSLIQLVIEDSSGGPIAPITAGVICDGSTSVSDDCIDVEFFTDRCSIEEAGVDTNAERAAASVMVLALSTANPNSYDAWENSAAADEPVDSGLATTAGRLTDKSDVYDGSDLNLDGFPDESRAAAVLGCNPVDAPGATPGVATIRACVEVPDAADICVTTTVTVIGPPASITVAASPTSLRCGEKSTITATVKDSIGQNVSDHTRVEMITNLGGVLAGQGAVAGFAGPVVPISSTVGETFGGVSTAFLLTSESHSGPYEVVATTGGTVATDLQNISGGQTELGSFDSSTSSATSIPGINVLGGVFSTQPISAQVTVTCNIPGPTVAPAATVTAPRTGTGIVPPNTGDAGLAGSSSSSWTLFAIGGMAAFALAGLASLKFARR